MACGGGEKRETVKEMGMVLEILDGGGFATEEGEKRGEAMGRGVSLGNLVSRQKETAACFVFQTREEWEGKG